MTNTIIGSSPSVVPSSSRESAVGRVVGRRRDDAQGQQHQHQQQQHQVRTVIVEVTLDRITGLVLGEDNPRLDGCVPHAVVAVSFGELGGGGGGGNREDAATTAPSESSSSSTGMPTTEPVQLPSPVAKAATAATSMRVGSSTVCPTTGKLVVTSRPISIENLIGSRMTTVRDDDDSNADDDANNNKKKKESQFCWLEATWTTNEAQLPPLQRDGARNCGGDEAPTHHENPTVVQPHLKVPLVVRPFTSNNDDDDDDDNEDIVLCENEQTHEVDLVVNEEEEDQQQEGLSQPLVPFDEDDVDVDALVVTKRDDKENPSGNGDKGVAVQEEVEVPFDEIDIVVPEAEEDEGKIVRSTLVEASNRDGRESSSSSNISIPDMIPTTMNSFSSSSSTTSSSESASSSASFRSAKTSPVNTPSQIVELEIRVQNLDRDDDDDDDQVNNNKQDNVDLILGVAHLELFPDDMRFGNVSDGAFVTMDLPIKRKTLIRTLQSKTADGTDSTATVCSGSSTTRNVFVEIIELNKSTAAVLWTDESRIRVKVRTVPKPSHHDDVDPDQGIGVKSKIRVAAGSMLEDIKADALPLDSSQCQLHLEQQHPEIVNLTSSQAELKVHNLMQKINQNEQEAKEFQQAQRRAMQIEVPVVEGFPRMADGGRNHHGVPLCGASDSSLWNCNGFVHDLTKSIQRWEPYHGYADPFAGASDDDLSMASTIRTRDSLK